jgi:hypothetical protein
MVRRLMVGLMAAGLLLVDLFLTSRQRCQID